MRIILIGMKGCGKTTLGTLLAEQLQVAFIDSDIEIEKMHQREYREALSFREIYKKYGERYFNTLETRTLRHIAEEFGNTDFVFACGGRTPLQDENQEILAHLGNIVYLNIEKKVLLKRLSANGTPAFFPYQNDPERSLGELLRDRVPIYKKIADITIDIDERPTEEVMTAIMTELKDYGTT